MKTKKAEMSVGLLVGIIVIILTLGIIALTFSQFFGQRDIDREVCRQSAIARGTLATEGFKGNFANLQDLVSLRCKTKRICVTNNMFGKGECERVFGDDFETYRVRGDEERKIKMLLAREMADCWDMLGRGNIAIFGRELTASGGLGGIGAVGIICSRIHFDNTITSAEGLGLQSITGLNEYLLGHKVPGHEVSYWDFLRNAHHGETMDILSGERIGGRENQENIEAIGEFLNDELSLDQTKMIMFIEARPTLAGYIIGGAAGGVVGVVAGWAVMGPKGGLFGGGVGTVAGGSWGDAFQSWYNSNQGLFPDGTTASGVFLSNYDLEGFRSIIPKRSEDKDAAKFEIASFG